MSPQKYFSTIQSQTIFNSFIVVMIVFFANMARKQSAARPLEDAKEFDKHAVLTVTIDPLRSL